MGFKSLPSLLVHAAAAATISAGTDHSCWIKDSALRCWGRGAEGQIAQGSNSTIGDALAVLPIDLGTGRVAKMVESGNTHVCAILDDDSLKCWGSADYGRLGLGVTGFVGDEPGEMGDDLPAVELGRPVSGIALGGFHTCAVLDNGQMKCWGYGKLGQLGQGNTEDLGDAPDEMGENLPYIDLGSNRTAIQAAAGGLHTCALLDNHEIKCWGDGRFGQLGLEHPFNMGDAADEMGDALPTVDLGDGRRAVSVSCGAWHTCALLDDATVKCWGGGFSGQLGQDSPSSLGDAANELGDALPAVQLGGDVQQVVAGGLHTCAILLDGSTKCWGWGFYGQLGQESQANLGDAANEMQSLAAIDFGGSNAVEMAAGAYHTCVLLDDERLTCFGEGSNGQLGDGTFSNIGDQPDEMLGPGFVLYLVGMSFVFVGMSLVGLVGIAGLKLLNLFARESQWGKYPAVV
ncbi:Ultraviolet-B receptor UVR8 (Protein UV-B RESISTANCE 8) (RCC1 domain-containing protein UVR8) [Durusdinium trenchii]|uniref:Ultraviolet-B receptor UVR8 (Protein UV-B RESISTANCE 8) (RCC1 domain-containing protein UVR8) n=1 Tax=Durusdinium trenchii TaxID=1381693 RepID=A0ABP0HJE3_9DINO